MKINTFIITLSKIKIEDGKFAALIFKCFQYIDQHTPVFLQSKSENEKKKKSLSGKCSRFPVFSKQSTS